MLEFVLVIIVGLIGGIAVGIQSPIAGTMGQKVGGTASSVIVHLSGLIIIGQLLTGIVLDAFGWLGVTARPIEATRLIGIVILLVGGYIIIK